MELNSGQKLDLMARNSVKDPQQPKLLGTNLRVYNKRSNYEILFEVE